MFKFVTRTLEQHATHSAKKFRVNMRKEFLWSVVLRKFLYSVRKRENTEQVCKGMQL